MSTETFDGDFLLKQLQECKDKNHIFEDLPDDCSEGEESLDSSDEDHPEPRVDSLRRFHLGGPASRVTPFCDLTDHVHNDLLANVSFAEGRVPLLVQYLTPLLMAEYDTLIVAPPGRAQIEALLLPIVNKVMLSLIDGSRNVEKRPIAVILSANNYERQKIDSVLTALKKGLPITSHEVKSIDGLNSYFDLESPEGMLDILVTTPAAYIAFTTRRTEKKVGERMIRYPSIISMERVQYVVIFELEELCDSDRDFSRIIANLRKEREFTLVIQTHTTFTDRLQKRCFRPGHAEKRTRMENMLNEDYGLVVIDSTLCIRNFVVLNNSELNKIQHLKAILIEHKEKFFKDKDRKEEGSTGMETLHEGPVGERTYRRRVVIVVSSDERATFLLSVLNARGRYHDPLVDHSQILHLEGDWRRNKNKQGRDAKDPMHKFKTGKLIGIITSNIRGVRMAHSVVDKVIFFDLVPSLHSLVLNCSKIVDHRRNIFLLEKRDLINKKEELKSLVQYLKDVDSEIPPYLKEFEIEPTSVKSIFV